MTRLLVIAGSLLAALSAAAQAAGEDEAARRALAAHDYDQVIRVYSSAEASAKPLTDMARYRLAIAHSKTQNPIAAWNQLQQALELNPKGTFASTPARLADLQASITAACESIGKPGCRQGVSSFSVQ